MCGYGTGWVLRYSYPCQYLLVLGDNWLCLCPYPFYEFLSCPLWNYGGEDSVWDGVPTIDTRNDEETITKVFDYHLTHDKVKRDIVPSQRDGYADLACYALNVAEGLQNS